MTRNTLLYGSSSPLTTSPPQHHLPLLSAFKAVFVSGARAQARAPNCSLCMYKYIMYVCVKCLCILRVYEFVHEYGYIDVCRYDIWYMLQAKIRMLWFCYYDDTWQYSTDIIKITLILPLIRIALVVEFIQELAPLLRLILLHQICTTICKYKYTISICTLVTLKPIILPFIAPNSGNF